MELLKIIILIVCIVILIKLLAKLKIKTLKTETITVVTGGIKTGKSALALHRALQDYRKRHIKWKIRKVIGKKEEEPLLYSNIPLKTTHYKLEKDHLLRKKRFNYKSVVYIDEASLLADSQLIKDKEINTELLLFCKLFGHETQGGSMYISTHTIDDMHYAFKRVTGNYIYISKCYKFIPFLMVMDILEIRNSENQTSIDNVSIEEKTKRIIIPKSIFKKYDCFCYSELTDKLDKSNRKGNENILKQKNITSFREYKINEN